MPRKDKSVLLKLNSDRLYAIQSLTKGNVAQDAGRVGSFRLLPVGQVPPGGADERSRTQLKLDDRKRTEITGCVTNHIYRHDGATVNFLGEGSSVRAY